MSKQDDGGPAFPGPQAMAMVPPDLRSRIEEIAVPMNGMSLRDYFAAAVMTGIYAAASDGRYEDEAVMAYKQADAMLEERKRKPTS